MLFYLFGAIAVTASLFVIAQPNPVYSVLLLIASFGALSGLYVLLDAPFVAAIQIIIYAGAIMVLFLFVVMLLHATKEEPEGVPAAAGSPLVLPARGAVRLASAHESGDFAGGSVSSVSALGRLLFTDYAFAFEVTSILILVAMVGAVVLARREAPPGAGGAATGEGTR
jgi:NADH-quinone oxidoreductase subunit J